MSEMKLLKLFIASPGDVVEERNCVKKVCDELNKSPLVRNAFFHLEAMGWEDAVPRAGDPQEIMNRVLSSCDMVICIFHKRFGSPTAQHASGTLDEFLFAYDNWKTKQSPYIALYFKTMNISSKSEFDDPQVKAVLEFKDKVQRERLVLHKDFSGLPEFRVLVQKLLEDWISELVNKEKIREKADEGEWTASEYDKISFLVRGDAWYSNRDSCRCAFRVRILPRSRNDNLGFRCARTLTL
ncbi:MAG: DUF4062 domain-containing protein [Spirochaetales bacterium]|nr:DUF4062 domain-containing protein [Spirochaetales bacterium]